MALSLCQRTPPVALRRLRQIAGALLEDLLRVPRYDLGITLVAAPQITQLNQTFLRHKGSTDVIAFDYSVVRPPKRLQPEAFTPHLLHGEIIICLDEAVVQARRFGVAWQKEVVRYLVHGLLHLCGYDDGSPAARRQMKQEEDRLLAAVARRFDLRQLQLKAPRAGG